MKNRIIPTGTIFLFGVFVLVLLVTYGLVKSPPPPAELQGVLRPEFRPLQPFKLTDHNNELLDESDLRGKWSFVFFGYASCPDICPTTMAILNQVQNSLAERDASAATETQVIFVSVDPARDTPEMLGPYVTHFNKQFIGATADKEEIDQLVRQFGAGYMFEPETAPGQYLVAHSSVVFLTDPLGRLVAGFSQPHYPDTIASLFEQIRTYFLQG